MKPWLRQLVKWIAEEVGPEAAARLRQWVQRERLTPEQVMRDKRLQHISPGRLIRPSEIEGIIASASIGRSVAKAVTGSGKSMTPAKSAEAERGALGGPFLGQGYTTGAEAGAALKQMQSEGLHGQVQRQKDGSFAIVRKNAPAKSAKTLTPEQVRAAAHPRLNPKFAESLGDQPLTREQFIDAWRAYNSDPEQADMFSWDYASEVGKVYDDLLRAAQPPERPAYFGLGVQEGGSGSPVTAEYPFRSRMAAALADPKYAGKNLSASEWRALLRKDNRVSMKELDDSIFLGSDLSGEFDPSLSQQELRAALGETGTRLSGRGTPLLRPNEDSWRRLNATYFDDLDRRLKYFTGEAGYPDPSVIETLPATPEDVREAITTGRSMLADLHLARQAEVDAALSGKISTEELRDRLSKRAENFSVDARRGETVETYDDSDIDEMISSLVESDMDLAHSDFSDAHTKLGEALEKLRGISDDADDIIDRLGDRDIRDAYMIDDDFAELERAITDAYAGMENAEDAPYSEQHINDWLTKADSRRTQATDHANTYSYLNDGDYDPSDYRDAALQRLEDDGRVYYEDASGSAGEYSSYQRNNPNSDYEETLIKHPDVQQPYAHFDNDSDYAFAHYRSELGDRTRSMFEAQSDIAQRYDREQLGAMAPWADTPEWTQLPTGASLMAAAREGKGRFHWSSGANRQQRALLSEESAANTYEHGIPGAVRRTFHWLGLDPPTPTTTPIGYRIPLSPEFIQRIIKYGVPALGIGGVGLLGASMYPQQEQQ